MSAFCNTTIQKSEQNVKLVSIVTEGTGIEPAKVLPPAAFKAVSSTNRTPSNSNQRTSKSNLRTLRCLLASCQAISSLVKKVFLTFSL